MPFPAKTNADQILEAALAQVRAEGVERLSLRQLAQGLGLVPNALYRYFPNRDALVAALADRATAELLAQLEVGASAARLAGTDVLNGVGRVYLQFAREHAHLYALVIHPQQKPPAEGTPAHERLWCSVLGWLGDTVPADDRAWAAVALWGYLHGIVELQRAGMFGDLKPDASVWGLEALLRGIQGTGTLRASPSSQKP